MDDHARGAFPPGSEAFAADSRFQDLAQALAAAADDAREAQGRARTGRVRFGYGLLQYDLRTSSSIPIFGVGASAAQTGLWGDPEACCNRFLRIFLRKYRVANGDIELATKRYKRRGPAPEHRNINCRFEALAAAAI